MVSKSEFLNWLHEVASKEEHVFVVEYSRYLEEVKDEEMRNLLLRLIKDSSRHALMLNEIINDVERGMANEF